MDAGERPAPSVGAAVCECRRARRSTFERDLVMAAISLVAGGRYPEVDVVNIDATDTIDGDLGDLGDLGSLGDLDAMADAGGVAIVPLEAVEERVHGLAVRRR